jgi:ligand-binding sensor domain-containing protein
MRNYLTILRLLRIAMCVGVCLLWSVPVYAAEPTLARLEFWVPPERMAEFASAYQEKVVPILMKQGLVESPKRGRATVDGVFSQLYAFQSPMEVGEAEVLLRDEMNRSGVLRDLGTTFGGSESDGSIKYRFQTYVTPSGLGTIVNAGLGTNRWATYDTGDGLGGSHVSSIIQAEDGALWFANWAEGGFWGGVSRYDGRSWTTFRKEDGLVSDRVGSILQDKAGVFWFGTVGGISRYDGETWTTFTTQEGLAHNRVLTVIEDREGNLWVGTAGGLSRYDGETWRTYTKDDGLVDDRVISIAQDETGVFWFGTKGGVSRYDGDTWTTYTTDDGLVENAINSIIQDLEGKLWFATRRGVSCYDGAAWTTYTKDDGLVSSVVRSVIQDQEGVFWFSTRGGVSRYDEEKWTTFTTEEGLVYNDVLALCNDREGNLWAATYGGGVSCLYARTITNFTVEDGLPDHFAMSIFLDNMGNLWAGSDWRGLGRYDGKTWTTFTEDDGLIGDSVPSIIQDREGNIWFGTKRGISRYDGQTWTNYTEADGVSGHVRGIIQDQSGHLWIRGNYSNGVSRFDGEMWTAYTTDDGLAGRHVRSMIQDQEGVFWFGTFDGLSRFDGEMWTVYTTDDGLAGNSVGSIVQDREGNIWFGTGGGVSRFDGEMWTVYTTDDGLAGNSVRSIVQDREGDIWFGTNGGVSRYNGTEWTTYTTEDGLSHNAVESIFQDQSGMLWFLTFGGVSRYDGQTFQILIRQDGLGSNSVRNILEDPDGVIWMSTGAGLTRFQPPVPAPPGIAIEAVVADKVYGRVDTLTFPSTTPLVSFEFSGFSYKTLPNGMVYRYRLKGYNNEWNTTRKRRVDYEALPVGRYTFEVLAVDRDLAYSKSPATVNLDVFYQPIGSVVQISEVDLQDVFPSFYKTYTEQSLGSVMVSNTDSDPIEATVSFYIPGLMPRPTEQTVSLEAHARQQVSLNAIFDSNIMNLKGDKPVQAEVSLSCEVGNQSISVKESQNIVVHGRGALTWDTLGRAAAFVTPEDPRVVRFSRGLWEDYRHQVKGRKIDGNIPTAMLMFEALTGHGIKYAQDSSSPYSQAKEDRLAVDHIQYPSELLQSRLGDCDDCTVLYCSLLENLNIPTAFVDAPAHILMLFDSGVTDRHEFGFSLDENRYIVREGRIWIPVEVTKLGEGSFIDAWELGAQTCEELASEGALRITDVRDEWADYPYALPSVESEFEIPSVGTFQQAFLLDLDVFSKMREEYVDREYIRPLMQDPNDHFRRMNLARTRIEAEDYQNAIGWLMPLLNTDDRAEANYLMGYALAGQKDFRSAVTYFEKALEYEPDHSGYADALKVIGSLLEGKSR